MEQRDYLLRQIQLMTQAIVALIRKLTGLKDDGSASDEEIQQATNEMLTEQFGMELEDILKIPLEDLAATILNARGMNFSNLELFAEVMFLNAKTSDQNEKSMQLLNITLELYEYINRESGVFSIDRHAKINTIKSLLEQNG